MCVDNPPSDMADIYNFIYNSSVFHCEDVSAYSQIHFSISLHLAFSVALALLC